ncbi:hypothetical protein BKA80DRAFT_41684 [Phyllosticta citrichinensis]
MHACIDGSRQQMTGETCTNALGLSSPFSFSHPHRTPATREFSTSSRPAVQPCAVASRAASFLDSLPSANVPQPSLHQTDNPRTRAPCVKSTQAQTCQLAAWDGGWVWRAAVGGGLVSSSRDREADTPNGSLAACAVVLTTTGQVPSRADRPRCVESTLHAVRSSLHHQSTVRNSLGLCAQATDQSTSKKDAVGSGTTTTSTSERCRITTGLQGQRC